MEFVAEVNGVTYVNDSKATNIGSLRKALEGFPTGENKVVVIAGGRDKGGDYGVLKEVMEGRVKLVIVIGEAKDKIAASLSSVCEIIRAESLSDAVEISAKRALTGDTVLLSPACSSFDMFKSFEDRGETFRRLVGGIGAGVHSMIRGNSKDRILIISTLGLVAFGAVMVYSTSYVVAMRKFGDGFYFVEKQIIFALIGFLAFLAASRIPYEFYKKLTYPLLILSAVFLVMLMIPGMGTAPEARRGG